MPWEDSEDKYPYGFSHPSAVSGSCPFFRSIRIIKLGHTFQVAIEASNGASDYGNKFGEPVICGFARSFGQRLVGGERCEYVKPIMFSGGIGAIGDFAILQAQNPAADNATTNF